MSLLFSVTQVRSLPIRKDDEVMVVRGRFNKSEGKVMACYRKKYVIHVERCTDDKKNGQTFQWPISASNVVITKIKMDRSRKAILDRKNRADKGGNADGMKDVD